MKTLFEISADLHELYESLELLDGDVTEADSFISAWMETIEEDQAVKFDGYAALIRHYDSRALVRKVERDRIAEHIRVDENKANRLRQRLLDYMKTHGLDKVECPRCVVSRQVNSSTPLDIPDESAIPRTFLRKTITVDRTAIREALKNGRKVRGAALGERGYHLRIR